MELISVHLYPFKGGQPALENGEPLDALYATTLGPECSGVRDRELFACAPNAQGELTVVTSRGWDTSTGPKTVHDQDSSLATLQTDILRYRNVLLTAPNIGSVAINLQDHDEETRVRRLQPEPVAIHGGTMWGFDVGDESAGLLSEILGRPVRVMKTDHRKPRQKADGTRRRVLAADGHPYLLTNQGSLDALNLELAVQEGEGWNPVPMRQYRPNIVIRGKSFLEDTIARIRIGQAVFKVVSASERCIVTNVDEAGGRTVKGLRVLRPHTGIKLDEAGEPLTHKASPLFGVNMRAESLDGEGRVRIRPKHSKIAVEEISEHPNARLRHSSM
ncbi:MAG TPA: MOSC domain-containing protein [Candidatus Saccharimonadales bacterium]|nr:MOSC domain-containing protein [Candidatus Saccharimonadales bacterium]